MSDLKRVVVYSVVVIGIGVGVVVAVDGAVALGAPLSRGRRLAVYLWAVTGFIVNSMLFWLNRKLWVW